MGAFRNLCHILKKNGNFQTKHCAITTKSKSAQQQQERRTPLMTEPESKLGNSLIFTTLTLNSTTLYSHENHELVTKHKLNDISEIVSNQMSDINSSKAQYGTVPIQTANHTDLSLYFIKYILPSNDIVIAQTCFSPELPRSLPITVLENILEEYKIYSETTNGGIEFKIKFNQIIKFNEMEFQNNTIQGINKDLTQVRNIMNDNIEQVLERNERINLLVNKTDRINNMSNTFRMNSVKVKRKAWWQNFKFWMFTGIGAIIALVIIYALLR